VNPILGAAMYERVPDALQTRVIGLCTTVSFIGIPIGALVGGWAVTRFGLRPTLITAGLACLVVNGAPLLGQRRSSLSRPVPPETPAEGSAGTPAGTVAEGPAGTPAEAPV
jgi:MFS family permease